MKKIILSLILVFLGLNSNSQNLIGLSKEEVTSFIEKTHPEYETPRWGVNRFGLDFAEYKDNKGNFVTYFFDDNICNYYILIYDNKFKKIVINTMNELATQISSLEWISYGKDYDTIMFLQEESDFFAIVISIRM